MASRAVAYGFIILGFAAGILLVLLDKDYDEQYEHQSKTGSRANLKRQEQTIGHWTEWTNQPCYFSDSGCFVIVLAKCNKSSTDADCPGFGYHLINCTAENCPAVWTEWTTGKDNNDRCIHTRERNCTGIPSASGCTSRDTDTMFCNTSEWSMWSKWTCHLDQYDTCLQYRSRECYVGLDQKQCQGEKSQAVPCTMEHCIGFLQPVWSEWTAPVCFNDSDGCYIVRNRTCSAGSDSHCGKHHIDIKPCGVNDCIATWLPWSHWECSRSQGQYIASRIRHCSTGRANDCKGKPYDSMSCGLVECPECQILTTSLPIQGSWLEWSHWECLDNTTRIVARRVRNCSTGDESDCDGRPYLLAICSETECPECYKDTTSSSGTSKSTMEADSTSKEITRAITTITTTPTVRWLEWSSWQCGFKDNTYFHARYRECSTGNTTDCLPSGDYKEFNLCINAQCPECLNFTLTTTEPSSATTVEPCEDKDEVQCSEPNFKDIVCKDMSLAEKFCRKTCKRCVPTWYLWTSWECNSKSGLTFQTRYRKCNSTGCAGYINEWIYCNQSICPECFKETSYSVPPTSSTSVTVLSTESSEHQGSSSTDSTLVTGTNPIWSAWTHFECSMSHGLAFRIRYRHCSTTVCIGDGHELYFCNQTACPECYLNEVLDTCRDETVQCKDTHFQSLVCNDTSLAKRHCQKTCNLCVPQEACRDGSGCDSQLQSIACNDPAISILCPVACGLCTPNKCEDVPRCNDELGSLVCNDPKFEALCPVRCGICTRNITVDTTRAPENTDTPDGGNLLTVQTTISPQPTIIPVGTPRPTFAMTAAPVTPNNTITTDRQKSTISYTEITTVERDKTSHGTTRELDTTTTTTFTLVTNGSNRTSTRVTRVTADPNGHYPSISTVSTPSKPDITSTTTEKNTSFTPDTPNVTDKIIISTKDGQINPMTTSATDGIDNSTTTSSKAPSVSTVQTGKTDSTSSTTTADTDSSSSSTVAGLTSTQKHNTVTISTDRTTTAETTSTKSMTTRTTNTPITVEKTTEAPTTMTRIIVSTTIAKTTIPTKTIPSTTNPSTTVPETSPPPTTVAKATIPPTLPIPTTVRKSTHLPTTVFKTTYPQTTYIPTTALKTTNPPTTYTSTTNTQTTILQTTLRPTTFPPTTAALTTRAGGGGHTISPDPTQCAVCVGPPELCDQLYEIQTCAPPNNYCINHVKNYEDGSRDVVRTCGNHRTCYREWFQGSSDNDKCQNFVEDNVITLSFECTYCCIKNECNIKLYPDIDTLYKDV